MSIISFNFTKLAAERQRGPLAKVAIKANTGIKDVTETAIGKQQALTFTFGHMIQYGPSSSITIEGEVIVLSNEKEAKETVASFKKNRTFSQPLTQKVYNAILTKANTEALILAKELNLPAPFRLPHLASKPAEEPKAETKPKKK